MNRGMADAPARPALSDLLLWAPEILFLTVTTATGLWARGQWLDPSGDVGIWWSLPDRLARGQTYYVDDFLQYGPLSPWLLAGASRLFGPSATAFLLVHWIVAMAAGVLLLRLGRSLLSTLERVALVGLLLGLSVFAPGTGRLVLSYCPAAVHAIVFSVCAFLILSSWREGRWRPYAAGALAGLALCAKQEIGVAAMIGICAPVLTTRRKGLSWVLRSVASFLIVAAIGIGFIVLSGASFDSLRNDSHLWPISPVPPQWRALFRSVAGMANADFPRSLFLSLRDLTKLGLLVSLLGLLVARERRGRSWWPTLVLLSALVFADLFFGADLLPRLKPANLLTIGACLVSLWGLCAGRRPERELLVGFGAFAALVGARTAFSSDIAGPYTGVAHFAGALTWVVFLARVVPDILPGPGAPGRRARYVWTLLLLAFAFAGALEGIESLRPSDRVAVQTPRGRVWVGKTMAAVLAEIGREVRPGERVLFLPETNAADVLFGLRDASPYLIHLPGWLTDRAEATLIDRFRRQPPDAVVVFERPTAEFRVKPLGVGFGRELDRWIKENYHAAAVPAGARILRRNQPPNVSSLFKHVGGLAGNPRHERTEQTFDREKERKGAARDDPSKPDAPGQRVEKRGVVSQRAQLEPRKFPLKAQAVPFEDDPSLRNVGSGKAVARLKTPFGGPLVVRLGREEPVEPFPQERVGGLDHDHSSAGPQDAEDLAKKRPGVGDVVKDVQHQESGQRAILEFKPVRRHDPVELRLGKKVGRHDVGTNLLDEASARSDFDDGPLRNSFQKSRQLPIMLAIERF